jgi:glycosyltransferase involved in cell wall biosynthesis
MSNYNHGKFLHESVQAILNQSYQPCEFIIIDDASTDNSVEIVRDFANKYPVIQLITNDTNKGILYNASRLVELSTGDYIYGAAADDQILPGFLEKSMNLLLEYPEAGICSCKGYTVDEDGNNKRAVPMPFISKAPCYLSKVRARNFMTKYGCWIWGSTVIYRREALIATGGFRRELAGYCDGFVSEAIALNYGACFIPEHMTVFRLSSTSYSSKSAATLELRTAMFSRATFLRRTEFRDIYPPKYVTRIESSQNCSLLELMWDEHIQNFRSQLNVIFAANSSQLAIAQKIVTGLHFFCRGIFTLFLGSPTWRIRSLLRRCSFKLKAFLFPGFPDE